MNTHETVKAYITKYALTKGIKVVEGEVLPGGLLRVCDEMCGSHVSHHPLLNHWHAYCHGEGREWHRTWHGALRRAEKMRAAKIKRLRAMIAKVESMEFTVPKGSEGPMDAEDTPRSVRDEDLR
ncbi:MAG TPA: hypothetical protein VE028_04115 [Nitratidesulfovibrio sp.]|nr:hypothetical protein [Nitratidesulfovibrio sp.]